MKKLIDTHAHLQFEKFATDRDEVVKRSSENLYAVINPAATLDSSRDGVALAQEISNFYAAVGVHPHHADQWNPEVRENLKELLRQEKVVAVGEVGLDKHLYQGYPEPDLKKQERVLVEQIEMARAAKQPILFHCRLAYDELYSLLKDYREIKGLIHCFMGNKQLAKKFLDLNLYISFAGNLTYKANGEMREAAAYIPNEFILTETDSPYLSPETLRGTRNEPQNVLFVAEEIAQVKNLSLDEVASFTQDNAKRLFQI